jgi:hypothetical protein
MDHMHTPRTIIDTGTKDIVLTPEVIFYLLNAYALYILTLLL